MPEYKMGYDPRKFEPHFSTHMNAITAEGLVNKSDIATELARRDAEIEQLRKFIAWGMRESVWAGGDLDAFAMQDKAEEMGILKKVPYNREQHGPNDCDVTEGQDWFVLAWAPTSVKGDGHE